MAASGIADSGGPSQPTSPSSGSPGDSPSSGSGVPGSKPKNRGLLAAAAVILVIAILIVGLGFANLIPGFHLSGNKNSNPGAPTPSHYSISVGETGLPSGTSWTVTLNGTVHSSTTNSISFSEPNGTYSYTVGTVTGYAATPTSGSVKVSGESATLSIAFHALPSAGLYTIAFTETGLPASTTWTVTLNGTPTSSSAATLSFSEANGSYPYTVGAVTGYTATPSHGTVSVNGADVTVEISFVSSAAGSYGVTFTESGLPVGTSWTVTVQSVPQSSTGTTITFNEPNGTHPFSVGAVSGYTASPMSGSAVVHGSSVSLAITYTANPPSTPGYYPLAFAQNGLPGNATWDVQIYDGTPPFAITPAVFGGDAEGASQVFSVPNGTYFWTTASVSVANGSSYLPVTADGNVTIDGGPASVVIPFVGSSSYGLPFNYTVTITEHGLPSGATWIAIVNGSLLIGTAGSPITTSLPNGTYYDYYYTTATNYSTGSAASIIVAGAPISVNVTFYYVYLVTFNATGIASNTTWTVTAGGNFGGGSGPSNVSLLLPNGSIPYTVSSSDLEYQVQPSNGTVVVAGAPVTVLLTFTKYTMYNVTFQETGLPTGTNWSVFAVLQGEPGSGTFGGSNGSAFTIALPDGNYTWFAATNASLGYWPSPGAGYLHVNNIGANVSLTFTYQPTDSEVIFEEASFLSTGAYGVPSGSSWGVTIGSSTQTTDGGLLAFFLPNGTYTYSISAPAGYWVLPGGGTLTVNTSLNALSFQPAGVLVAFLPGSPPAPPGLVATTGHSGGSRLAAPGLSDRLAASGPRPIPA